MTEITIYRADDGTDFEYEEDCLAYEWNQRLDGHSFRILNYDYRMLDPRDSDSYENAFYLFLPTEKSFNELRDAWDYDMIGIDTPDFIYQYSSNASCGLWAYDPDNDNWYHLGNRLKELEAQADRVMKTINGF